MCVGKLYIETMRCTRKYSLGLSRVVIGMLSVAAKSGSVHGARLFFSTNSNLANLTD